MCRGLNVCIAGKSFAEKTPLDGLRAPMEKVVQTVHLLCEGMGIRAISRFTGLNQETVLNILEMAGQKAMNLLDQQIRNVECESVQCDEIFAFVQKKEFNNLDKNPDVGTQYVGTQYTTYLGIDRKTKLIISHLIGKERDRENATAFMGDLKNRLKGTHADYNRWPVRLFGSGLRHVWRERGLRATGQDIQ